jgi:hypothetical protein
VPYVLDPTLLPAQRPIFVEAIRELETVARLKFVPRTNETDYIRVFTDPTRNWVLLLRDWPRRRRTAAIAGRWWKSLCRRSRDMHALGIMHEHIRNDRDGFVSIDFDNIIAGAKSNFALLITPTPRRLRFRIGDALWPKFLRQRCIETNITVKAPNERFQTTIGQSNRISEGDKKGLRDVYGPLGELVRPSNDNFARPRLSKGQRQCQRQ